MNPLIHSSTNPSLDCPEPTPIPAVDLPAVPAETDEQAFARLARLSPAQYDRLRDAEAKRLGIRKDTLDREIARFQAQFNDELQRCALALPHIEPWPEPVNGPEVLTQVTACFPRYLVLPPGAADALSLWCAHAHAAGAFLHTPRLNLSAPDRNCGKTTTLDVLSSFVPRPLRTENITAPVLFRLVDQFQPTLLLDEVDAYLNQAEELRGLLNAGHKRGACAYRCEGESNQVRPFKAFGPAALAGIGSLPGTLHDRSICIHLVRAKPDEILARFDTRHLEMETMLCRQLARWTRDHLAELETCDPALPPSAFNRLADNWRPLLAIAQVAGGDWPERALAAFAQLTAPDNREAQGTDTMLLADIRQVFAQSPAPRLFSSQLVDALCALTDRPWPEVQPGRKPITEHWLAQRLRPFGVLPHTLRIGEQRAKGYELQDFTDAFQRFLPTGHPVRPETGSPPGSRQPRPRLIRLKPVGTSSTSSPTSPHRIKPKGPRTTPITRKADLLSCISGISWFPYPLKPGLGQEITPFPLLTASAL